MTTPNRFAAGAIDLGEVKARAEAKAEAEARAKADAARAAAGGPSSANPATGGPVALAADLTMDNVEAELIKRSAQVAVIVLIGTARSPESEQLKSDFTQLAQSASGRFVFRYIDADSQPQVAQMFGIQGLPTVVAIASGQPIANFEGGQPLEALQQWTAAVVKAVDGQLPGLPDQAEVDSHQEEPEDPRFVAAAQALQAGDFDNAIAQYEEILAHEPKNKEAMQARDSAKLLKRLNQEDGSANPVADADADPHNVEKAFAAADAHIAEGNPEAAFDRLIALMSNSSGDQKGAIKDRLLELFALFEATDARVITARSKMASALF